MKYFAARSHIRSGDLLAWSHRGWGSWYDVQVQIVRMFTRSEYSHVGVAWVVGGRVFVIEAVSAGVRIFPLSRALPFYHFPGVCHWNDAAERFALGEVGAEYESKWRMVVNAVVNLRLYRNKRWQCAEFVVACFRAAGNKAFSPQRATPPLVVADAQAIGAACYLVKDDT